MNNLRLGDVVGGVPDVDYSAGLDLAMLGLLGILEWECQLMVLALLCSCGSSDVVGRRTRTSLSGIEGLLPSGQRLVVTTSGGVTGLLGLYIGRPLEFFACLKNCFLDLHHGKVICYHRLKILYIKILK